MTSKTPDGEYRIPPCNCPYCGHLIDAAGELVGEPGAPKPDDWSVCISCASPLRFTNDLRLRMVSAAEIAALPLDLRRELELMQDAVQSIDRRDLKNG